MSSGHRKRKTSTKNNPVNKKISYREVVLKKDEINDVITKPILPVILNENLCVDDCIMKTRFGSKAESKVSTTVIPKIKITCKPLNVEKIIDFENNKVINNIKKIKKKPGKKLKKIPSSKTKAPNPSCSKLINLDKNSLAPKPQESKTLKNSKKRSKEIIKEVCDKKLTVSSVDNAEKKKPQISCDNTEPTIVKKSHNSGWIQSENVKQLNVQVNTSQNSKNISCENLNTKTFSSQEVSSCSQLGKKDNEFVFIELNDLNLEELQSTLKNISDEELKMKLKERENEANESNEDYVTDSTVISGRDQSVLDQVTYLKKTLQVAVENFMNNPQLNFMKENTALKKGLCSNWLSNNYVCSNQQCLYSHNALNLFTKKLKQYPSKFIMAVVVSMRNDTLFVDVIMAAFKVLSERQISVVWVTFLIYFVFYVTDPSDFRFLKFWANSARFFSQSSENYTAAKGFSCLLSIFSQGETSEQWKIIEFINLIKQPPVQVPITYALLQPVLHINLPSQFLFEAVESSIVTQKDLIKVHSQIIPKISFMTLSIQVVELLLKFCKTLEKMNLTSYSDDLKRQLQARVLTFKTKITQEYPLTSAFQEKISAGLEENCLADSIVCEESSKTDLETLDLENNYFQLEDDFCNLLTEAIEFPPDLIPDSYRNTMTSEKFTKTNNNNNSNNNYGNSNKEDLCEGQVTRIRQFFRDCQFHSLAKYLNDLKTDVVDRAAEEFIKLTLQMKISLQQVVDLVKIMVLPCNSENASKAIASISITLILNLIRINEWEKAYIIASFCQKKRINLVEGKVFLLNELKPITQCRIALLLIEIYAYKNDYTTAVGLVKKYNLFSTNYSLWNLNRNEHDEIIRVRILEDLLQQIISSQITEPAFDLFELIWKEQSQLLGAVDLRKFANEVLILFLNHDNEKALNLYEKIKDEVQLNQTTVRAILVTYVRLNHLSSARSLLLSTNQYAYRLPELKPGPINVMVSNFWLEEEMYSVFDAIFDLLVNTKQNFVVSNYDLEIQIHLSVSKKEQQKPNTGPQSVLRPLCLGIIKPSFKDACTRIQRVLQYQFNPPLKLIVMPYSLKLDEHSLQLHLKKRLNKNSS